MRGENRRPGDKCVIPTMPKENWQKLLLRKKHDPVIFFYGQLFWLCLWDLRCGLAGYAPLTGSRAHLRPPQWITARQRTPTTIKQSIKVPATETESVLQPAEQTGSEEGSDTLPGQPSVTPEKSPQEPPAHLEKAHMMRPGKVTTAPDLTPPPTVRYPYSLHMGSFKTRKLAEKALALLNRKGLTPYWTVVDLGDRGVWYRVFVGHFKTADAARAFQAQQGITADRILKTRYSVQVGLYSTRDKMDQQNSLLKASGYCPYVIMTPPNQYQLLVGAFQTEEGADHLASGLKAIRGGRQNDLAVAP